MLLKGRKRVILITLHLEKILNLGRDCITPRKKMKQVKCNT